MEKRSHASVHGLIEIRQISLLRLAAGTRSESHAPHRTWGAPRGGAIFEIMIRRPECKRFVQRRRRSLRQLYFLRVETLTADQLDLFLGQPQNVELRRRIEHRQQRPDFKSCSHLQPHGGWIQQVELAKNMRRTKDATPPVGASQKALVPGKLFQRIEQILYFAARDLQLRELPARRLDVTLD